MPIHSRHKGNSYELKIINLLKGKGWTRACSSRAESKKRDAQKVDICYSDPINVQCKAVERFCSYHTILGEMPNDGNINVIWHKKNRMGSVVALKEEDFLKILDMLIESGKIKPC